MTPLRRTRAGGAAQFQHEVADAEASAALILEWHPRLVPGLLQTPAYAREIFTSVDQDDPEIEQAVAGRMARQAILYDSARSIQLLVAEAALRWPIATVPTLLAQLDRLALFAADGTVRFGVVPFDKPFGAFSYHGWVVRAGRDGDEPDLVEIELETAEVNVTDIDQVAAYRDAFERLAEVALYGDDAAALIRRIRMELSEEHG